MARGRAAWCVFVVGTVWCGMQVARAELLFYDGVTAATRTFSKKNDGEFKFPRCQRYFEGSVSIARPGLSFPAKMNLPSISNAFIVSDGSLVVVPFTQAMRYHLERLQEREAGKNTENFVLCVSMLVRFSGTIAQPKSGASVVLRNGARRLVTVGKTPGSGAWRARGYQTVPLQYRMGKTVGTYQGNVATNFVSDRMMTTGTTHILAMTLSHSGTSLAWQVQIDPSDSGGSAIISCGGTAEDLPTLDAIEFEATGMKMQVDEIRIATTKAEAMPWMAQGAKAADPAPDAFPLRKEQVDAVVIVKGENGEGTGFLGRHNGKTYLYSNIHLLMGNRGVKFLNQAGYQFKPTLIECADDRDLVRITVANPTGAVLAVAAPPAIKTPVAVCPHAEGETQFRPLFGTVVGSGPVRIETDALFVDTQAGSPIIASDGAAVGVATLVRKANENWVSEDTPFVQIRRFGCRIDTVGKWIAISPEWFSKEGQIIADRAQAYLSMAILLNAWAQNPYLSYVPQYRFMPRGLTSWAAAHNDLAEKNAARLFSGAGGMEKVFASQVKEDATSLKTEIAKAQRGAPARWSVPYFKECWTDLENADKVLVKAIDRIESKCIQELSAK